MERTRAFTAAVAVLAAAILAGAGGCTSAADGPGASEKPRAAGEPTAAAATERISAPEDRACKGGTYTWFNTRRVPVLNGVTDFQRVTVESTKLTEPMQRLRTDQASLESDGPRPDPRTVLFALSVHLGFSEKRDDPGDGSPLGKPGTYAPVDEGGGKVSGHSGRIVSYSSVSLIDTDFRHTCGHGAKQPPTVGHVTTWSAAGGGVLDCDEPLDKNSSDPAHEAERLSCGR
ncbi:hypothetical protein ACIQOF_29745 [Streptomyces sp. NPDC091265]|uniref:hypothetical protein n=1 Tax=unclassified Streptomyces TaxID=2593676 RepID=UPI00344C5828